MGLKCVRTSRIESLLNLTPLYTFVSKNVASVSEISAMNLIVGWIVAFDKKDEMGCHGFSIGCFSLIYIKELLFLMFCD